MNANCKSTHLSSDRVMEQDYPSLPEVFGREMMFRGLDWEVVSGEHLTIYISPVKQLHQRLLRIRWYSN